MAAPAKKRATEEVDMSEDDVLGSEDDDDIPSDNEQEHPMNEEVQVEFEARSPEGSDFHSIKGLLQQLFLKANINLSELTDTLLSQSYVGSVIKQCDIPEDDEGDSDEDQAFGITSVINITHRQALESVKQLKSMLTNKCKEAAPKQSERLQSILAGTDKHVGFLINERFINIPPQIAPPLFNSLRKEMEKASKKNLKYNFDWYLLISKTYRQKPTGKKNKKGGDGVLCYTNQEEEFLQKHSTVMFEYSVSSERDGVVEDEWDAEEDMEALRTVLIVSAEKFGEFVTEIETEVQ